MDSLQFAAGNVQIARMLGSAGEDDRIEVARKSSTANILAYFGVGNELHAFGRHLFQAAIDDVLLQFELRNTVTQQAADAVGFFVDGYGVAGAA